MLIATLFGSAVARKPIVVLDWNVIAGEHSGHESPETHSPKHDTRQSYNSLYSNP